MWFFGLLIGLVLGNIAGAGKGAFIGSILGLFGGLIYEQARKRKQSLEERVTALEKLVQQVSAQAATLNSAQQPAAQAKAESMPLSAATQQPATVTPIASIPVDSPSTPPLIEPATPSDRPAFSNPIRPTDSLGKMQHHSDIASVGSLADSKTNRNS